VMGPQCSLNQVFWPVSLESPICYGLAVEMSYQFIVMLGITISTFPGCRCDYVFDVSDAIFMCKAEKLSAHVTTMCL
jgi:hypothetical protein